MKNSSTQKERILQFIDYKNLSKNKFYIETGISNGILDKNSGLSMDTIEKFYSKYPEINPEWLLTGKGEMLKNINASIIERNSIKGIPLIPTDAMAGHGTGSMQIMNYETSYYEVPEFTELRAEFMIRVKGSSMYPKYSSGDLLACKKVSLGSFFQWNKVYVLDTEQGPLVKRVKPSNKEEYITLVSDNPNYDPFDIHLEEIHSIACVLGVIRLE